jgi:hypothetical protein
MKTRQTVCLSLVCLACSLSARADTTDACINASSQGQVELGGHKLVEARDQFLICAQQDCPSIVRKFCSTWLDQAQASLPTVVLLATDASGNSVPGIKVFEDGRLLVEHADGRAVEVDPGTHRFAFVAPNGTQIEKQAIIGEGEKDKRVVATLAIGPTSTAPPPAAATGSPPRRGSAGPWRLIGIGATGVGAVGLALGSAFGLEAASHKRSAGCNSTSMCPSTGAESTLKSAQNDGNWATAFFVVGGALAAGGVLVWVLAPGGPVEVAPSAGAHAAGVLLRGAW